LFILNFIKRKDLNLIILGDGPNKDNLEKTSADLEISDRVFFIGLLKHIKLGKHLKSSDLFIFLTNYSESGSPKYT